MDYGIGDMVKDAFGRTYIVVTVNRNNLGQVYNVSLSQIAGKPVGPTFFDTKGFVRLFPTDVSKL